MSEQDQDAEERILAAAHAVFVRSGTAGARMQEIADEAGVNKALLHYYFRSKERLAQAVFERTAATMFTFLFELISSTASLEEKIRAVVSAQIDFLREHPYLPGYIISELHHHPERITRIVEKVGTPPLDLLEAQLEEGARRGELRPIGVREFVVNLVALVVFPFAGRLMLGAMLGIDDEGFDALVDQRKVSLPEFVLNALRP